MASCVISGPMGWIWEPDRFFSSSLVFRLPPCQQLSHPFQVFMKGEAYSFSTSPLCQISVYDSSRCLSVSSCQEHITSASVAEYHSSDQLGFKMLLSSTEHPPPPSETSPPPQTSPLMEDQQGGARTPEAVRRKALLLPQQHEPPRGRGMVRSCQAALPL